MVPWPIALLSLWFAGLAALSGSMVWKIATGAMNRSMLWPVAWWGLSTATMFGLALLKPWARSLAIVGLLWVMLVALILSGSFILAGQPWSALLATMSAGLPLVIIRYLRRPVVKAYFSETKR
jgi:hypothetical protein